MVDPLELPPDTYHWHLLHMQPKQTQDHSTYKALTKNTSFLGAMTQSGNAFRKQQLS